jgi:hypothetical protein
MDWNLPEAENKLCEVMTNALNNGPQRFRRGDEAVIVLSEADYQRLTGKNKDISFKDFLLSGPGLSDLDSTRDQSPSRSA